jgi:hypothetical protein
MASSPKGRAKTKPAKTTAEAKSYKAFASRPPELTVLTDHALEPVHGHLDSFNLRYRIGPIYDIVRHPNTRTPLAIAIYGDWGTGKTSAMRWLHGLIDVWKAEAAEDETRIRVKPVWFYPWKYDKKEDVWRGLISEVIINTIDVEGTPVETVRRAAKQFGIFLGRSFLHVLAGVKLKASAPGDMAGAEIDLASIKDIVAEYRDVSQPEKAYLNEFESSLTRWIKSTLKANERMVIFIDDLDRCMPEIALQVLEALKLYLNIEKLVFVVGVDRHVIDNLVKEHYKKLGLADDKSGDYLAKMFQVEVEVEPSEQQISDFLDRQLEEIPHWRDPYLEAWETELFRDITFSLSKRNPREVKRLINSALMTGTGAVMMDVETHKKAGIEFDQGLQLFFVRKILEDRYTMGLEVGSRRGIAFFQQWSKIAREGRKRDAEFPLCIRIPADLTGKAAGEMGGSRGEPEIDREDRALPAQAVSGSRGRGKTHREAEFEPREGAMTDLSKVPEPYRDMVKNPIFSGLIPLLEDEDLGKLMQVPFPGEVAEVVSVVGGGKDPEIIREAVARHLGKKPDQLVDEDLTGITTLDLSGAEITDIEPLKQLTALTSLYLSGTQVTDIEPLKQLTALREIYLGRTQISGIEPVSELSQLRALSLYGTPVSNIKPLRGLKQLEKLILTKTRVTNLEPLKDLVRLEFLYLSNTQVTDIGPLEHLKALKWLWLIGTEVPEKGITNLQTVLPEVHIVIAGD